MIEDLKRTVSKHFELFVVFLLLGTIVLLNFVIVNRLAFLNFYYLPTLVAAYILGKRTGVLTGVLSILFVIFSAVVLPEVFLAEKFSQSNIFWDIIIWGSFLIITGYVVGTLYEEKEKGIHELKDAYEGVLEILAKYIDSIDRYTKGHSVRVSEYAMETAIAMELPRQEVENIRVAGLLHDIGKIEISSNVIKKAASLTDEERNIINTHTEKGAKLIQSVGGLLKEAVPLVLAHHDYYNQNHNSHAKELKAIPLGARIIAIADAYDAMTTDRPYRKGKAPWQALEEIEKEAGKQFDPKVVEAFKMVVASKIEEKEALLPV